MRARGFTLVELLVVLAAVGLLLSIAAPRYIAQVDRARDAALAHNLKAIRDSIDRFESDRGRYPLDLQELVRAGYLRSVPVDPVTERSDTWVISSPARADLGRVKDVRSGAHGQALDGRSFGDL